MAIEIKPYEKDMIGAVKKFNARLEKNNIEFRFNESEVPNWLPKVDSRKIYQEQFLAIEDNSVVRGAFMLKHQDFLVSGRAVSIANYQLPISEGSFDKSYNIVGIQLVNDALKRQPLLFVLGVGGRQRPLPKMLKAVGWKSSLVPFYFLVKHPKVVKVGDVVRFIDGPIEPIACADLQKKYKGCADIYNCLFRDIWPKVAKSISGIVDMVTFKDLCNNIKQTKSFNYHI